MQNALLVLKETNFFVQNIIFFFFFFFSFIFSAALTPFWCEITWASFHEIHAHILEDFTIMFFFFNCLNRSNTDQFYVVNVGSPAFRERAAE